MTSALLEVARDGRTSDKRLKAVFLAKKANEVMGGAAIMPWDVENLPDEWLDVFCGLADELPGLQEMNKNQARVRQDWLAKNGYRSYLSKR